MLGLGACSAGHVSQGRDSLLSLGSQWLRSWKTARLTGLPFPQPPPTQTSKGDLGKTKQNPHLHRSLLMGGGEWEKHGPSPASKVAPGPHCILDLGGWHSFFPAAQKGGEGVESGRHLGPHPFRHPITPPPLPTHSRCGDPRLQSCQRQNKPESIHPRVSSTRHFLLQKKKKKISLG